MIRKIWLLVLCLLLPVLNGCASYHQVFYFSHGFEEVISMEIYYLEYATRFSKLKEVIANNELPHLATIDKGDYEYVMNEINGMEFTETIFLLSSPAPMDYFSGYILYVEYSCGGKSILSESMQINCDASWTSTSGGSSGYNEFYVELLKSYCEE